MKKIICTMLVITMSFLFVSCGKDEKSSESVDEVVELTLADKVIIATFQGAIRDIADYNNDVYETILSSISISDVSVKQYNKSEASSKLLNIIEDEPYGDSIIEDQQTWIVCASFSYINEKNTLVELEDVFASVQSDGSATFGKGITYSAFGESKLYVLYEDVYNNIAESNEINIDLIESNLTDNSISIEVQKYIRDLE